MADNFMGELDFTKAKARVISTSPNLVLEFREVLPNGNTAVARLVMTLGQLMVLKTQVAKDFNFGF